MALYYYAAGQKVELEPDDEHVAVDQKAARSAGVETAVAYAGQTSVRQGAGVTLASRADLPEGTLASLRAAGALRPVYKRERAVLVALPEIRVEFDNVGQRLAVKKFLGQKRAPAHTISEDTNERLVVRPASGKGDDALTMANEIYERAHPASSAVRFVQFVPKPGVSDE